MAQIHAERAQIDFLRNFLGCVMELDMFHTVLANLRGYEQVKSA